MDERMTDFLCTKKTVDENKRIEQQKISAKNIVDYFVSLQEHKERAENFVFELKTLRSQEIQQCIWNIYEIFSRAFVQKIQEEPLFAVNIQSSSPWPLYIKEHNLQKINVDNMLFIDCETTGLYGEYLSFAMLLYDRQTGISHAYYIQRNDVHDLKNVHPFVSENVIPRMELKNLQDYEEIKTRFTQDPKQKESIYLVEKTVSGEKNLLKESAQILKEILDTKETGERRTVLLAESPYPVEFRFFEKMFDQGAVTSEDISDFSERLHDWHSVKINFKGVLGDKGYHNSIHNALVDVLINYDECIKMEERKSGS